jgi:DNA-binding transcriptional regulator LsrR (DeoR family)
VRTEFDSRVVGLELADLRAIDTTVLVAGGLAKVPAILGALRGGYINTLITDEVTASKLLESHGASPS